MEMFNNTEVMHDIAQRPNSRCLFDVASGQSGFFTTTQAETCGFQASLRAYHRKSGRWIRTHPGVYRLIEYPSSQHEEIIAAWLWAGKDIAAVSHESALDLLNLADTIPSKIHLTVPRSSRHRSAPAGIALHTTTKGFQPGELITRGGLRLTSAVRTIVDSAEAGTAPEQIVAAIKNAVGRGLASTQQLRSASASSSKRVGDLILRGLSESTE
jgi:predicted transcriptional regulator of viral defense system